MSGGGGKGGSQTSQTELPDWLSDAAQAAVGQGQRIGQIGYVPYNGPDVAAMTPLQNRAMQNTSDAASAFGMADGGYNGLPAAEEFANGMRGYSSRPLYADAKKWLARNRPGQFNYMQDFFVGAQTGEPGQFGVGGQAPAMAEQPVDLASLPGYQRAPWMRGGPVENIAGWRYGMGLPEGSGGQQGGTAAAPGGGGFGGYTGLGDMIDGGGPGASGGSFQGGGAVSAVGNAARGLL